MTRDRSNIRSIPPGDAPWANATVTRQSLMRIRGVELDICLVLPTMQTTGVRGKACLYKERMYPSVLYGYCNHFTSLPQAAIMRNNYVLYDRKGYISETSSWNEMF